MTSVDQKFGYLKTIDIFQDLSQQEMLAIDTTITMSTCQSGKVFYRPEDKAQVLFILKKGRVQLYKISPDGKKLIISTIEPGTVFGQMAMLGQKLHGVFAEAVDDCLLCVMSRYDVERLIMDKPQVGIRIMNLLLDRLQASEKKLEELAFKTISGRLAGLLLQLSAEDNQIKGYTHQDLADTVGAYRETVTQTLNEFKAAGIIDIGRKQIKILDSNALAELAEA